jgi:hypothetical protein
MEYILKRDLLCGTLQEAGLTPSVPKGAYYVLADASILPGKTSKEKAMSLLQQTGVATVAGSAFYHGDGGENLLRFCFAKTDAELAEACLRLKRLQTSVVTKPTAAQSSPSYHLVIEGRDAAAYWLHVAVQADTSLQQLDSFLREKWLECCGHLSAFIIDNHRYSSNPMEDVGESSMDVLVGQVLQPTSKFYYEYDFGSPTELTLTVATLMEQEQEGHSEPVQLLARNELPNIPCENCGESIPATRICSNCAWSGKGWLCEKVRRQPRLRSGQVFAGRKLASRGRLPLWRQERNSHSFARNRLDARRHGWTYGVIPSCSLTGL